MLKEQTFVFDQQTSQPNNGSLPPEKASDGNLIRPPHQHRKISMAYTKNRLLIRNYSMGRRHHPPPAVVVSDENGRSPSLVASSQDLLTRILEMSENIDEQLRERYRTEIVIREWQTLARVLERVLMFVFVVITAIFIIAIFSNQGPRMMLTEELMNQVKK